MLETLSMPKAGVHARILSAMLVPRLTDQSTTVSARTAEGYTDQHFRAISCFPDNIFTNSMNFLNTRNRNLYNIARLGYWPTPVSISLKNKKMLYTRVK